MRNFHSLFTVVLLSLLLASCKDDSKFSVEGTCSDGSGKMAYLYKEGIDQVSVLDSAEISKDGSFRLKADTTAEPELYSVRIDNKALMLSVDSSECINLSVKLADWKNYSVSGSDESKKIKEIQDRIALAEDTINNLMKDYEKNPTDREALYNKVNTVVLNYKKEAQQYIQKNSSTMAAYYTLFKQLPYGIHPFDVTRPEDFHSFILVANRWNKNYPDAARTLQLKDMLANLQKSKENQKMASQLTGSTGFIDLEYPDCTGKLRTLNSLKGKTILLEFCYLAQLSDDALQALRATYDVLHSKGLEIYMVNYDKNQIVWRENAAKYPWISVLDAQSSSYATYNINVLPTNYLISADGSIIATDVTLEELANYMLGKK